MFKVFWVDHVNEAYSKDFEDMGKALTFTQELRNIHQRRFVTMVCEDVNQVGKMGVSAVEDGVLPNGDPYTYKSKRR
jgi:hypothetical protein